MTRSPLGKRFAALAFAVCLLLGVAEGRSEPPQAEITLRTIDDLKRLTPCELCDRFSTGDVSEVPSGRLDGAMIYVPQRMGKVKAWCANLVWRGKNVCEDTSFANRWIGNIEWLRSHYVIGPSWMDGKPALVVEYPRGTPLFANMRDEMRCVGPGLFLAAVFDRCPKPCFTGFLAIETACCAKRTCGAK